MTIDEAGRHRLHQRLDGTLGEENATVLMERLPPTGWADVATRHDLHHLRTTLELKIDATSAELRTEMYRLHNRMLLQLVGAMAGLFTVFFVLARVTA
jgi:hypothetical protein